MNAPREQSGSTRRIATVGFIAATLLLGSGACFSDSDGRFPDVNELYFPTALVLSPGAHVLYVANSDFDLKFAGGWLQAVDAAAIRSDVAVIPEQIAQGASNNEACASAGRSTNPNAWIHPGPCDAFPIAPYVRNSRLIGAFASGMLITHDPDKEGARLFTSVRGDPSITYFDVEDDRDAADGYSPSFQLDCDVDPEGFCGNDHRVGRDPDRSLRNIQLPADPVGLAANDDGSAIVAAHQTQNAASLIHNVWGQRPELSYFASNLSPGPTEVAALPEPGFIPLARDANDQFLYRSGFALTFSLASEINLLRHFDDNGAVPPRPFLVRANSIPLVLGASGIDSRGVAIVADERRACETSCGGSSDALQCLSDCAEQVPLRIYVANRSPASLLIGRVDTVINRNAAGQPTSANEEIFFFDTVPLNFGPARLEIGSVIDSDGNHATRVFASCFDSRAMFIFDPFLEKVESVIRTGRGPHDMAIDAGDQAGEPYAWLYVGHFTDSYIGVVDLDMRRPLTFGQIIASVGIPIAPQENK